MLRAVAAIRLSVLTDETTSPERQRTAIHDAASHIGADIGDREALDLGVSASKTTPFERPGLAPWLARPDDYDAIIWWRLDRAVRSMADMHALVQWARTHKKILVFAEGPGGRLVLDLRSDLDIITSLILQIFAFAAEFEASAIRDRVVSAQSAIRATPLRWRGAHPPYGYKPAPLDTAGWTLVPDPETAPIVARMVREVKNGASLRSIAESLTADGIPTPSVHRAKAKGRPTPAHSTWSAISVKTVLTSWSLIGYKSTRGRPVRDSHGVPVPMTTTPLLTRAEFDEVQAAIQRLSRAPVQRKDTSGLLLHILHCANCGHKMYKNTAGKRPTYVCGAVYKHRCAHPVSVRAGWVDDAVSRIFLDKLGGVEITRSVVHPGYDPGPEIAETLAELEAHMAQQGRQRSKAAQDAWQRRADALDRRLAELESRERQEPRVEYVSTGETYADRWVAAETAERRRMLMTAGVRVSVRSARRGPGRYRDESRLDFKITDPWHAEAADELAAVRLAEAGDA